MPTPGGGQQERVDAEVVVPVRWDDVDPEVEADFTAYLADLGQYCDVTVVDGSQGPHAAPRRARWAEQVRVLTPAPARQGLNGKVAGALTGIEAARHERVVVADDDVRYDRPVLAAVVRALHDADLVIPQDYPTDLPWWTWWESGLMLLNRAVATDWPGTCAVRRSTVLAAGGWSADVLYENLELARTVTVAGGRLAHRPDLLVARRPPSARHLVRQRVRQAYEDQAEPVRLGLALIVLPTTVALLRRPALLAAGAGALVAVAEAGRRRAGGCAPGWPCSPGPRRARLSRPAGPRGGPLDRLAGPHRSTNGRCGAG